MGIKTQPNTTKKALVKTTKEKRVTKMKLITSHTTKGKDEKTTQKKMSDSVHTKPHSAGKRKRGSAMHPTRKSPHSGSHGKGHLKSHSKGWLSRFAITRNSVANHFYYCYSRAFVGDILFERDYRH